MLHNISTEKDYQNRFLYSFFVLFVIGGYYFIERKEQTLQIIVLNTNLWTNERHHEKAEEQWKWLDSVFQKLKDFKKPVKVSFFLVISKCKLVFLSNFYIQYKNHLVTFNLKINTNKTKYR